MCYKIKPNLAFVLVWAKTRNMKCPVRIKLIISGLLASLLWHYYYIPEIKYNLGLVQSHKSRVSNEDQTT